MSLVIVFLTQTHVACHLLNAEEGPCCNQGSRVVLVPQVIIDHEQAVALVVHMMREYDVHDII